MKRFTKKAWGWGFTVFFALAASAYMPSLYGLLCLLVAAALLPIDAWQDHLRAKLKKGWIKTALTCLLIFAAFMSIPTAATEGQIALASSAAAQTASSFSNADASSLLTSPSSSALAASAPTAAAAPSPSPAPASAPTQEPAAQPKGTDYIINTNTGKFHYPSCSSVDKMKESNKWYFTGTRDEVLARGYAPCQRCDP